MRAGARRAGAGGSGRSCTGGTGDVERGAERGAEWDVAWDTSWDVMWDGVRDAVWDAMQAA